METAFYLLIVFGAITFWKYLGYRREVSKDATAKSPKDNPEQEAEVKTLRERVENLETLICRLDTEINYQLERSIGTGKISTAPEASGHSQMPTTFMNVATALEGRYQILKELGRGG